MASTGTVSHSAGRNFVIRVAGLGDGDYGLIAVSSFRDAPLGAGPESITTIGSMDSGLALRAPRNDGADVNSASPWLLRVARRTASSSNP
jgi:hypothetical protein